MLIKAKYYLVLPVLLILAPKLGAQDINYDSLLTRIDTVENPVYKPVISASFGVLNFRGDVQNSLIAPTMGNFAGGVNVATYIDRKNRNFIANFNFMVGKLTANQYSFTDLDYNLNFESSLYSFGLNVEYRFGHLIENSSFLRPYLSLGIENVNFASKGDLIDAEGSRYYYWSDGGIRDMPEDNPSGSPRTLYRDYSYETDLRLREIDEFGLGAYNQSTLAIPVGLGLHFALSERAFFSLGMSYHYTLSDYLDNVAFEGTSIKGSKGNDSYVFTHLSLHFDMFSDPSTRTTDLLFADAEFDPLFFDDEDGDFVLDVSDLCPGTPYGVEVDSLGCPLDLDEDGVPDYRDKESWTLPYVWVDDDGVTLSEEDFYASLESRNNPMARGDVAMYMEIIGGSQVQGSSQEIPEKFKALDEDGDGYISFDELLKTVDRYFDYELELDLDGLRELNQFFFSQ